MFGRGFVGGGLPPSACSLLRRGGLSSYTGIKITCAGAMLLEGALPRLLALTALPQRGGAGQGVRRGPSAAQGPFPVTALLLPGVGRDTGRLPSRHRRRPLCGKGRPRAGRRCRGGGGLPGPVMAAGLRGNGGGVPRPCGGDARRMRGPAPPLAAGAGWGVVAMGTARVCGRAGSGPGPGPAEAGGRPAGEGGRGDPPAALGAGQGGFGRVGEARSAGPGAGEAARPCRALSGRRTRRASSGEEREPPLPTRQLCGKSPPVPGLESLPRWAGGLTVAHRLVPRGLGAVRRQWLRSWHLSVLNAP